MALENRPLLDDSAYALTHSGPDMWEQLVLELVNRARANPSAEANRQGTSLGSGVSSAASQPLAINGDLLESAQLHSDRMIELNFFSHRDPFSGTSPFDRINDAGYFYNSASENIGWIGSYASPYRTDRLENHHDNLWNSLGHRQAFMSNSYSEAGLGFATGSYSFNGTTYPQSSTITQNFGDRGEQFLTGVVIDDVDLDGFYDVGEGLGGVKITAYNDFNTFATSTWASGGYSLELPSGTYTVVFEGAAIGGFYEQTITIGTSNIKLDVIEGVDIQPFRSPADNSDADTNPTPVSNPVPSAITDLSTLYGRVFEDENKNGVDDGEQGGAATRVFLFDYATGTIAKVTQTDENGDYSFANVEGGRYQVRFERLEPGKMITSANFGGNDDLDSDAIGAWPNSMAYTAGFDLTAGDNIAAINVGVIDADGTAASPGALASVSGRIFEDDNANGRDDFEAGAATTRVFLVDMNAQSVAAITRSGSDGAYGFQDIEPGRYQIRFETLELGKTPTIANIGNDHGDSDGLGIWQNGTAYTGSFDLAAGQKSTHFDLGVVDEAVQTSNISDSHLFDIA